MIEIGTKVRLVGVGYAHGRYAEGIFVADDKGAGLIVLHRAKRWTPRGDAGGAAVNYSRSSGFPVGGSDYFAILGADLKKILDPAPTPPKKGAGPKPETGVVLDEPGPERLHLFGSSEGGV